MRRARRVGVLLIALTGLAAPSLVTAPGASAATDGVAPVCGTAWGAAEWYGTYPFADTYNEITGQKQYVDGYYVARGTLHECASQMYEHTVYQCANQSCSWAFSGFRPFTANAVPNVIDAAGGDEQTITVTLPQAVNVYWGQCLPRGGLGTVTCPSDAVNPAHSGTVLFRARDADGLFRGPWTAAQTDQYSGFASPGFQLRKVGAACANNATSCTYTVKFTRDTTNLPAVRKDIQLLLQFDVRMMDDGKETGAEIAVPVVVVQQGGGAKPAPGQQESTGPATTGGGVSSAGSTPDPGSGAGPVAVKPTKTCTVPEVAKLTLAKAQTRLKAAGCVVGTISKARSRTVAKGRVIRAGQKAGKTVAAGTKVSLVVSRGRR